MAKQLKADSKRTPPAPSDSHAEIDAWLGRQMPDLQPILKQVDKLIRKRIPRLQYAIKWKRAYYGLPDLGWIIELAAYDVSANVVFLGGAGFGDPPPDGTGPSRYVKLRSMAEADAVELRHWIDEAAKVKGWG
jgi:hypothetical protein